jgi:hypothetical protein
MKSIWYRPRQELSKRHDVMQLGLVPVLQDQADRQLEIDANHQPFATRIEDLAKGFEIGRIKAYNKRFNK